MEKFYLFRKYLIVIIVLFFIIGQINLLASDKNNKKYKENGVRFKGLMHVWYAVGMDSTESGYSTGFNLRRTRLKSYGNLNKSMKWYMQFAYDKQKPSVLDAAIDIKFFKNVYMKIGKQVTPGSISGAVTSVSKLKFVERAMFVKNWSNNSGLSSYRTIGVQIYGTLFNKKLLYALMAGNPDANNLFTPSVSNSDYSGNEAIQLFARIEYNLFRKLKIGSFFIDGSESLINSEKTSIGFHCLYNSSKIYAKGEYIQGNNINDDVKTVYSGAQVVFGYKIKKIEPIIRYDYYISDPDASDIKKYSNFTIGMNFIYSKNFKVLLNYVYRSEKINEVKDFLNNDIFYINFQTQF